MWNPYKFVDQRMNDQHYFVTQFEKDYKHYFFYRPEDVKEIFQAPSDHMLCGAANKRLLKFLLGDKSLMVSDHETYKDQKRTIAPFFKSSNAKKASKSIEEIMISNIEYQMEKGEFNLQYLFNGAALEVIIRNIFGITNVKECLFLKNYILNVKKMGSRFSSLVLFFPILRKNIGPLSLLRRYNKAQSKIDEILLSHIRKSRQDIESSENEFVKSILHMDDEMIRDQLMMALMAGQVTVANTLTWLFKWLSLNPAVEKRLIKSLRSYNSHIEAAGDEYLDACLKETLRIYPTIVHAERITTKDFVIRDKIVVPAGSTICPLIYGTHHLESLYPDSFQFKPERFLEKRFSPFEYYPFGGGVRRCTGEQLSLLEMKIAISVIFRKYNIRYLSKEKPKPIRTGFTMSNEGGLRVRMIRE